MIELNADLPPEIFPLSWLIGVWEGTGVVHYDHNGETLELEFGQRVSFSIDGLPYINYSSQTWLLDGNNTPHASEVGYWRLARPVEAGEAGPGLLPGIGERSVPSVDTVEELRNIAGTFDIEVSIAHPDGITELYLGTVSGPRIDLATDAVIRSASAKPYSGATRLYGFVEGKLLWAWDIAALGQGLRTHASGSMKRVD